jgi:putative colanic acid biosynthesis glycosyltransferase WcaE
VILTIATVVRNDLEGLRRTLESGRRWMGSVEWWVIDGSSDRRIRTYLSTHCDIRWISETDNGIYDAMNKALDRATGDYLLFLNAGDTLHSSFDPFAFFDCVPESAGVLLGRVVEIAGPARYLRPGFGREDAVFDAAPHQATFYPRTFYSQNRYADDKKIGADGDYTGLAIRNVGATFIPAVVAEFRLGGISSSYESWTTIEQRLLEGNTVAEKAKIIIKTVMWRVVPRRVFYAALAAWNHYTRLEPCQEIVNTGSVLHRPAASAHR